MPRKSKKSKKQENKRGTNSRSSTPQSITPSAEDDGQQLLRSVGSSEGNRSRSAETNEGAGPSTSAGKRSYRRRPNMASSSREQLLSRGASEPDLFTAPAANEYEGSPKKRPRFSFSRKSSTKPPSREASPSTRNQGQDGPHSSSSDLSVGNSSRNHTDPRKSPGKGLLSSPKPEKPVGTSPWKSPKRILAFVKPFRRSHSSNRSSNTKGEGETDESDSSKQKSEKNKTPEVKPSNVVTKSTKSSSSGSSVSKENNDGLSSGTPQSSNSKSSIISDPSAVKVSSSDNSGSLDTKKVRPKRNLAVPSISTDHDPLEGTSRRLEESEGSGENITGDNLEKVSDLPDSGHGSESLHSHPSRSSPFSRAIYWLRNECKTIDKRFKLLHVQDKEPDGPIEDERELLKNVADTKKVSLVQGQGSSQMRRRRVQSAPMRLELRPCSCKKALEGKKVTEHDIDCALYIDLRRRRKWRSCRQSIDKKKREDPK